MIVTIIGLGLIGGSMAIDLKKRGFASWIIGVDNDPLHANTARQIGLVDEICELEEGVKKGDFVVIAVPVDNTVSLLPVVMDMVDNQTVMDVCSTKELIMTSIEEHDKREQFVATHPMAGTEHSGPWAAISGLFDGKAVILTNILRSNDKAVEEVKELYDTLGMRPVEMEANDHDIHVAYVSHISHISSFGLALTVLDKEKNEKNIFNLASGGFDSTVRLAMSSSEMWTPIFLQNRQNILAVLNTYLEQLESFKKAIQEADGDRIDQLISDSNKIRKVLHK